MDSHILADERQLAIRALLASEGRVLASDLAARFGVSEDTARRDLRSLARAGLCRRVYGGAVPLAPHAMAIAERAEIAPQAKARLARRALSLLEPGQLVLIDSGTTTMALARALPPDLAITVATPSIGVAAILAEHPSARLIMLGGSFAPRTGACAGIETLRAVERLAPDLCFLGACGLDARAGITAFDADEADVKRAFVAVSRRLAVAATADRIGTAAPFRVAPATAIDHLIVEAGANAGELAAIAALGCRVDAV